MIEAKVYSVVREMDPSLISVDVTLFDGSDLRELLLAPVYEYREDQPIFGALVDRGRNGKPSKWEVRIPKGLYFLYLLFFLPFSSLPGPWKLARII